MPANGMVISGPDDSASQIVLSEQEQPQLKALERDIIVAKVNLADLQMQIMELESKRLEIINKLISARAAFLGHIQVLGRLHGIDTEDPSKGRWNFDTTTMKFSKIN